MNTRRRILYLLAIVLGAILGAALWVVDLPILNYSTRIARDLQISLLTKEAACIIAALIMAKLADRKLLAR